MEITLLTIIKKKLTDKLIQKKLLQFYIGKKIAYCEKVSSKPNEKLRRNWYPNTIKYCDKWKL